jgi:hypothetical protein
MSETIIEDNVPMPEPVVEPIVPIVEPEKEYRYQPKDEQGRKLGGEQVIKYKTNEELADKLAEQNTFLVRKLREQTRKNRLGISDTENIPEGATKFELPLEFKPRQLTPDERVQLSRDLLDPERCEQATTTMFESAVGVTPTVLRDTLSRLSQNEMSLLARVESDAFMASNKDYYRCKENSDAITGWMIKNNLAPLQQNFQLAYDTLKKDDVLLFGGGTVLNTPAPVVAPITPVVAPSEEVAPIEPIVPSREAILEPVVPVRIAPPPTGLTRVPSADGEPPKAVKYTLKQVNDMDGETYKQKLLHEKGFAKLVQDLEDEAASKRGRR